MKNKLEIINLEKTLEILDILGKYIDDNNEIKPEFYEEFELITKLLSIFSGKTIEELEKENIMGMVYECDNYIKINEILEANKIVKHLRMR